MKMNSWLVQKQELEILLPVLSSSPFSGTPSFQQQVCLFVIKLQNRRNCSLLFAVKRSGDYVSTNSQKILNANWKSCRSHFWGPPLPPGVELFSSLLFTKGLDNLCQNYTICHPSLPISVFHCSTASFGELFISQAELPPSISQLCPGPATSALENRSDLFSMCLSFLRQ